MFDEDNPVPTQPDTGGNKPLDGLAIAQDESMKHKQISAQLWKQADEDKEKLFALMEQVRAKWESKTGAQSTDLNLRRCNWAQVMQEVQESAQRWKATSKKTSRAMLCIGKLGQCSGALESWLELLPNGDYGASICGVFKLAVRAAGQYRKVQDAIFEELSEIPEIMESARRYIQIYADQQDSILEKKTFDLFRAILGTLIQIMRCFVDSSIRKLCEPVVKQSSYKSELFASIEEIKKHTSRLKEEASLGLQQRVRTQGSMLSSTHETSEATLEKTEQTLHLLHCIYSRLSPEGPGQNSPSSGHTIFDRETPQPRLEANNQRRADIKYLPNGVNEANRDETFLKHQDNRARTREIAATNAAKHLLELLEYDSQSIGRDTTTCFLRGQLLDEQAEARASAMIRNKKFKTHAEVNCSTSLLVNGRIDLAAAEGLSPLSLVVAKLARISEETGSAFVVKYFCDQHRPNIDLSDLSPAVRIMISLTGQLVTQLIESGIEVDLSFLTQVGWQQVAKRKLSILCIIFRCHVRW